jgi:hypothetical protein
LKSSIAAFLLILFKGGITMDNKKTIEILDKICKYGSWAWEYSEEGYIIDHDTTSDDPVFMVNYTEEDLLYELCEYFKKDLVNILTKEELEYVNILFRESIFKRYI